MPASLEYASEVAPHHRLALLGPLLVASRTLVAFGVVLIVIARVVPALLALMTREGTLEAFYPFKQYLVDLLFLLQLPVLLTHLKLVVLQFVFKLAYPVLELLVDSFLLFELLAGLFVFFFIGFGVFGGRVVGLGTA